MFLWIVLVTYWIFKIVKTHVTILNKLDFFHIGISIAREQYSSFYLFFVWFDFFVFHFNLHSKRLTFYRTVMMNRAITCFTLRLISVIYFLYGELSWILCQGGTKSNGLRLLGQQKCHGGTSANAKVTRCDTSALGEPSGKSLNFEIKLGRHGNKVTAERLVLGIIWTIWERNLGMSVASQTTLGRYWCRGQ